MDVVSKIIEQEIIDRMTLTVLVSSVVGSVISVSNTGWIRDLSIITDDNDITYKVVSFVLNESITVDKTGFVGNVKLPKPKFLWGTKNQATNEYHDLSKHSNDKLPLIWLQDGSIIDSKSKKNTVGAVVSGNIFFLDFYNAQKWLNTDIAVNSLYQMNALSENFKATIENNFTFFQTLDRFIKTENTRFGKEDDNGVVARYFGDDLSGIGVNLEFSIYNDLSCPLYIDNTIPPTCAPSQVVNSNDTYSLTIPSGTTSTLPDTFYTIEVDGVEVDNFQLPTLEDSIITIELI